MSVWDALIHCITIRATRHMYFIKIKQNYIYSICPQNAYIFCHLSNFHLITPKSIPNLLPSLYLFWSFVHPCLSEYFLLGHSVICRMIGNTVVATLLFDALLWTYIIHISQHNKLSLSWFSRIKSVISYFWPPIISINCHMLVLWVGSLSYWRCYKYQVKPNVCTVLSICN